MKIVAGKYYLDAEGNKRGPMLVFSPNTFHEDSLSPALWDANGSPTYSNAVSPRLIAEWTDEPAQPTTGTLAELNVQPGDVVECVDTECMYDWTKGKQYTVSYLAGTLYCNGVSNGIYDGYCIAKFSIISRASQSTKPVANSTTPPRTITTHGTWTPHGYKPKTQYVYNLTFDLDTEGHPIWSSAKVTGR